MKLSVIIVNYNVKYYVEQCLNSLAYALDSVEHEIFVVDNHSKDDSVRYLSRRFKNVSIIDCNHNLGFARANNIAIRQSTGEYVLLLNPDTFVGENTIRNVLAFVETHPNVGGVGVKMYNPDGSKALESRRGLPTPLTSLYKMVGLCARFPRSKSFGRYYLGYLSWDEAVRIEVISGAFCFLRRSALDKVGLLDEDFFMYGEDIDLSYRLLKGGYENWYLPFPILHYKGESTHKSSFRYVHVFYQAMLVFFSKHYGHLSFCITIPIKIAIYIRAIIALVTMQSHRLHKSLGFAYKRDVDPKFVFVGGKQMTDRCRVLSRRKGLNAEFHLIYDVDRCLDVIQGCVDNNASVYMVFDVDTFSYESILDMMSHLSKNNIKLGTYSNKTKIIITPDEIIK